MRSGYYPGVRCAASSQYEAVATGYAWGRLPLFCHWRRSLAGARGIALLDGKLAV